MKTKTAAFTLLILALLGLSFYFFKDPLELVTKDGEIKNVYVEEGRAEAAFENADEFPEINHLDLAKESYLARRIKFAEADLTQMKLTLYRDGELYKEFEIISKGKEGSWWETPTGKYEALSKIELHFSSIGKVWMPWSVQFHGNYFIHGWPYYQDGTPVSRGYSGGCIRLKTQDGKEFYHFVEKGTPIIVREEEPLNEGSLIVIKNKEAPPDLTAKSYLVSELASQKISLEKGSQEIFEINHLTQLMTATVASDLIYLERSIIVNKNILAAVMAFFDPSPGERYIAFDLLYPLMIQSSQKAANLLAGFLGRVNFVSAMNRKAEALGMANTKFEDSSGKSGNNSNARDLNKLARYIHFKQRFLFDISKGVAYRSASGLHSAELKNANEFWTDSRLVGMKNANARDGSQMLVSVWKLGPSGDEVPFSIIVLGSKDRVSDTNKLLKWVEDNI